MSDVTGAAISGTLFDLDTFAVHDGPGIRMTVYLKGCPLSCAWCHSPESQRLEPELTFVADNCVQCGACITACSQDVHTIDGNGHSLHRENCLACGACALACAHRALAIKGYVTTAQAIVDRAAHMRPFFRHSGGGVTLTGGEVTLQPAFAEAVLRGCRALGIHTAIETCGACSWVVLERLVAHTDLVLYDVKLMDEAAHRRWTGVGNAAILANLSRLSAQPDRPAIQVRTPLIPGLTDTDANLGAIVAYMAAHGLTDLALLPYNAAAGAKYEWLGRDYALQGAPQSAAQLAQWVEQAATAGVRASVS